MKKCYYKILDKIKCNCWKKKEISFSQFIEDNKNHLFKKFIIYSNYIIGYYKDNTIIYVNIHFNNYSIESLQLNGEIFFKNNRLTSWFALLFVAINWHWIITIMINIVWVLSMLLYK